MELKKGKRHSQYAHEAEKCALSINSVRERGVRFPKENNLRSKWSEVICRPSWSPSERSVICSLHFTNDSFYITKKRFVKLISGSIPSLLLPPKPVTVVSCNCYFITYTVPSKRNTPYGKFVLFPNNGKCY
ncbi:hypothetical protein NQ318_015752 [Aromia moschata]|uniref:THAP-type domain-containing protein n=1 Tax=Aromia moschata TaxID=1265417 RepID=A0AAV8XQN7_9CUCU|nr:hypothetical protein NQ318_015752 [Aromia moschata]